MKRPHLAAAFFALAFVLASVAAGDAYAQQVEREEVSALAPLMFTIKSQGSALQREAFGAPDLLPLYGSSELAYHDPYRASTLFRRYPTGFTVFPVGLDATEPVHWVQEFAALGPAMRGKKVAISLSPQFLIEPETPEKAYAVNFSARHAFGLILNADVDRTIKRDQARRMLQYDKTLGGRPLLRWMLTALAGDWPWGDSAYYALWPLARLQLAVLELEDDWGTLTYIGSHPELTMPQHVPAALDWPALAAAAGRQARAEADSNVFGVDNAEWPGLENRILTARDNMTDARFFAAVQDARGWSDLDLLFRTLKELNARPLILCMPIHGVFYDYRGVSAEARRAFYARLEAAVAPYGFPLLDFADHDVDRYFLTSPASHLSPEGWVYYDRALDAFFHDGLDVLEK